MMEFSIFAVLETSAFMCFMKSYGIQEESLDVSEYALFLQLSGCIMLFISVIWFHSTIWPQIVSII